LKSFDISRRSITAANWRPSSGMLRRLISNDFNEFFDKLNDEQKAQFKGEMLNLLQTEPSRNVPRKIVDLVAETSRSLMDDDGNNLWDLVDK
jgi:hypothetical protein